MTPSECMQMLGLGESASFDEIKRTYRHLAQDLHPDKNRGDERARKRFVEVSRAYRSLASAAAAVERGVPVGTCVDCGEFGAVTIGTDGHPRCGRCIFRPAGGHLLPFPVLVVVKCASTFVLLGIGLYLLLAAVSTGGQLYAAGAFVAGLLGLAVLAHTCISVVHCLQPTERVRCQRQHPTRASKHHAP